MQIRQNQSWVFLDVWLGIVEKRKRKTQFSFHQFPSNYIIRDEWIKIIESNGGWKDGEKTKVSSVKECCVCSTVVKALKNIIN